MKELKKWKPKETFDKYLQSWDSFSMIITGMSKAGKSYLLKDLISPYVATQKNKNPYFDFTIVFSKTLCNGFYQSWLDTKFMYDEFDEKIVHHFKQQTELYKNLTPLDRVLGRTPKKIRTLFIIDDCLSASLKYQGTLGDLFMTSRHWGASVILIGQKMSFYSLSWQANSTIIISMFSGSFKEKKYIAENVIADAIDIYHQDAKMHELFRIAYKLQTTTCVDYNALIVLPLEREDKIFQYRAP